MVLHYLIEELHWGPADIDAWLEWDKPKKAIVMASIMTRGEAEKKHMAELERRRK